MKYIYVSIIGLFMFLTSCVKQNGNEFKPDLEKPSVEGFEKAYTALTRQDVLTINPKVKNEEQYDFYWTLFSSNYIVGTGIVPKGDTLARTKDFKHTFTNIPGSYFLVLNIKDKNTKITQMITSNLTLSTPTMSGWYLLKDDGNKTDFDFIYEKGRIDNWMAFFNDGKSLTGKSIKSIFSANFKVDGQSKDLFSTLVVISDNDAGIFRLDNGKKLMGFENMFFTPPANKRPQNVLQPTDVNSLQIINDGKLYTMFKGALFANLPASNYKISSVAASGASSIIFDENSKTVLIGNSGNYAQLGSLPPVNGNALKNMNADLIWMAGYPIIRSAALALFRKPSGEGSLFKLNTPLQTLNGSTDANTPTLIQASNTVPSTHGLMSADIIGGNHDADYIYYGKGNNIYLTDLASLVERLQYTLPAGEVVTCIQHIKYPAIPSASNPLKVDYLAIATYINGTYKVYLHTISSTGTIQPLAQPNFTGQGKVTCVNYLENGNGNRTY